ncbi:MAG: hypothetical protein QOH70_2303 [Blastocatellia bacterium]|nr:hypothetical protein [Blastocatellia bacterium]
MVRFFARLVCGFAAAHGAMPFGLLLGRGIKPSGYCRSRDRVVRTPVSAFARGEIEGFASKTVGLGSWICFFKKKDDGFSGQDRDFSSQDREFWAWDREFWRAGSAFLQAGSRFFTLRIRTFPSRIDILAVRIEAFLLRITIFQGRIGAVPFWARVVSRSSPWRAQADGTSALPALRSALPVGSFFRATRFSFYARIAKAL